MTTGDVSRIIEKLEQMTERLAVMETKLDHSAGHSDRISSLERSRALLGGLVVFIGLELQALGILLILIKGEG